MKPIGSILKNACPECNSNMILRNSKYGLFYGCINFPKCKSTHGAHNNSGEPLGIPGNEETRKFRIQAHGDFDNLWRKYGYTRKESYKLLQNIMALNSDQAHIAKFNISQCKLLIKKLKGFKKSEVKI